VVGLVLVAASVLIGARVLAAADDTVSVWATLAEVRAGQPVTASDLVSRRVRFTDAASAARYLDAGTPLPAGLTARRDVGAGELLPGSAVASDSVATLQRVPVTVDTAAVPATIHVGSVVNVWVTADPGQSGRASTPATLVFEDVPVVAVPMSRDELAPQDTRQVIIGVDDNHASALPEAIAAITRGTVLITQTS
jgi:hypothetical protein